MKKIFLFFSCLFLQNIFGMDNYIWLNRASSTEIDESIPTVKDVGNFLRNNIKQNDFTKKVVSPGTYKFFINKNISESYLKELQIFLGSKVQLQIENDGAVSFIISTEEYFLK